MYVDTNGFEIEDVVRDRISGFEGVIIGITQWTTGCARASVQPQLNPKQVKEGTKIPDAYAIDCLTLEMVRPGPRHVAAPDPVTTGLNKGGPPTLSVRER